MGVQQSRRSNARTARKRAAWLKTEKPNVMECPQCHSFKLPHRICTECGFYNGREVLAKKEETTEE